MSKRKKVLKIGITIGDIHGIGPELIIKAFSDQRLRELCTPIVYGSTRVLNFYRKTLDVEKFSYNVIQNPSQAHNRKLSVIDCVRNVDRIDPGKPDPSAGRAAFEALEAAVADLKSGEISALLTNPIDKSTIQNQDFQFPGHTEYLASAFDKQESLMLMISNQLRMGVVTGHIPLQKVSAALSKEKIYQKIKILHRSLQKDFNISNPRIAVLGLNPHAGDNGLLGKEDHEVIRPAVKKASDEKMFVFGPYPADGFFGAGQYNKFDGVLAMYHDQGLIPFKLLAGFEGVNFTAGIQGIRTSPDHGLAYNLAGRGVADTSSFIHALYAAIDIVRTRSDYNQIQENKMEPVRAEQKQR